MGGDPTVEISERIIGKGLYGEVRAGRYRPRESNTPIAVKIINLDSYFSMINRPNDNNQNSAYIEKIIRRISELEELTGNNKNRNFNKYKDNLIKDNKLYLSM